jgi:hypothetical protein
MLATAPQQAGADLAAVITQHLEGGSPGSADIARHYPRVQVGGTRLAALRPGCTHGIAASIPILSQLNALGVTMLHF